MPNINVFKASAGSGKTFTLAVQYITLLITREPQEYRKILAVTFTNKATAEMKDRILEQLYGIGNNLESSKNYLKALQNEIAKQGNTLQEDEIRKRCRQTLKCILHDYSRFRIETIDSFLQSVLRNLAHELGLNARLQVDLNDKQIISQAVDNLIDGLGQNTKETSLQEWFDEHIREKLQNDEAWDMRKDIKSAAELIFQEEYQKPDQAFKTIVKDKKNLEDFRREIYEDLEAKKKKIEPFIKALGIAIQDFGGEGQVASTISNGKWVTDYYNKLKANNFEDATISNKRYDNLSEPNELLKKADKGNPDILRVLEPLCTALRKVEDERKQLVRTINSSKLTIRDINPLCLLQRIDEEVTNITNDTNRFLLIKTPLLLSQLIQGSDAPFVFERMGTIFNHMMIDEFQDTSRMQWRNFRVLLVENQATGGTGLLVGDIKQSIYRFRGGDWHILKDISNELGLNKDAMHTLDTNYRSDKNIIRFNNTYFTRAAEILANRENQDFIKEIYSDVKQHWPEHKEDGGHVRVMLDLGNTEGWEDVMLADMCNQIKHLHDNNVAYSDMTILLRTRTKADKIINYVYDRLNGVKVIGDEGFLLNSSCALQIMIAALRRLSHGNEDIISERYLVKSYLQYIEKKQLSTDEYTTAKVTDVLPEEFIKNEKQLREFPLYELCKEIYRIFRLNEIKGEDPYVLSFFDELSTYLRNGTSDILSFLEYWETDMRKKAIPGNQVDGINLVTIHKAKGLQYHTVFMPYCDKDLCKINVNDKIWCETIEEPYNQLGEVPISGGSNEFQESCYNDSYKQEQLQRRIEELNVLYVSFTRAEHNLYIWGDASYTKDENEGKKEPNLTQSKITRMLLETMPTSHASEIKAEEAELLLLKGDFEEKTGEVPTPQKDKSTPKDEYELPDYCCMENPSESDLPETVTVWTVGKCVVPVINKEKGKKKKEEKSNRLSPKFEKEDIRFQAYNRTMNFRQSNEAAQYIRNASEEPAPSKEEQMQLSYIDQGKLLHEILSRIITLHYTDTNKSVNLSDESREYIEKLLKEYTDNGIITSKEERERIQKLLCNALCLPGVKTWFNGEYVVQNECEITSIDSETGQIKNLRPDRVLLSAKEIIVVDYKFGRPHPEDYISQVQSYMRLIKEMYPDKLVKGYLWYVYRREIEEVKPE